MSNHKELQKLKGALNDYQQAKLDEAERIKKAQEEERLRAELEQRKFIQTVVATFQIVVIVCLWLALGFIMLGK